MDLLSLQEALVLLRQRWQMEMLYQLWKQYGRIDEWRTANPWRVQMPSGMPNVLGSCCNIGSSSCSRGRTNSEAWSSWHKLYTTLPVLCSKLLQATARFALPSK
ncbi:MAG TPA: hypothetical protein VFB12_23105 [Ktedonobacteraceae bacterium]|nr:hypothetical protein [Ktedonobacteraceae bacterium]